MASQSLAKLSVARRALTQAKTLQDVLDVCDVAAAVRSYVKAAGESLEIQNAASDIRLSAERKAGELLASMDLKPGAKPINDSVSPIGLDAIGITGKQSSRWQLAAKLPEEDYAAIVDRCNTSGKELTQAAVLRAARIFVFGEPEKSELPSVSHKTKASLIDLIAMARASVADLVESFGQEHIVTLIGVLRDELETLEANSHVGS